MKVLLTAIPSAVLGSILSLTLVGQAQTAKTPSAVAVVSAGRILTESSHGRSQTGRVQTLQQQRMTSLRAKQQTLEATRQQLASTVDAPARIQLQQKENQERADLERSTQQAQMDLQNLQREVSTELQQRIKAALDDLMKTQPYQLVISQDTSVAWSQPELDLTSAVIARMNGQ